MAALLRHFLVRSAGVATSGLLASCAARPAPAAVPPTDEPADRIAIVASERGPQGARLVAIDELGDRQFAVISPAAEVARDAHPAISPDGRWIVFASSRERALDVTSLWIAPLGVQAVPIRLTAGDAIDAHPTWTTDGRAIVFASTRARGEFDLWRLAIEDGRAVGEPEQLTSRPGHEVTPTVGADGTVIYAAVTPTGGREVESHLEERAPDGTITRLTDGPADGAPALSPDGRVLAFARPLLHGDVPSSELWQMARGSDRATPIVALPLTEESGPVWSRDGRFVFATSVLRGEAGVLFSSVIHVDLRDPAPRARMLHDSAGAIARLTPAIATPSLDTEALRSDPEYVSELARILAAAIEDRRTK